MRTFFVLVIIFNFYIAKSQDESIVNLSEVENNSLTNNKIGVTFSILSGFGLTYLHTFDNRFSLKSHFAAYGNLDQDSSSNESYYIIFSIGSELQYDLLKFNNNRCYLLGGCFYSFEQKQNQLVAPKNTFEIYRTYNLGIGAGYELQVYKRISFALDIGYYGNLNKNSIKESAQMVNNISYLEFSMGAGFSFYYNF